MLTSDVVTIKDLMPVAMPIMKWCFGILGGILLFLILAVLVCYVIQKILNRK